MKKLFLLPVAAILFSLQLTAQVPDFTVNDCDGVSQTLYDYLNNGNVVVMCWVMPCSACIGPALTSYNIADSYSGQGVKYFLMDDFGNSPCVTVDNWANNNGIGANRITFSDASIIQADYGGLGMPHVAVIGSDGQSYFNGLNSGAGDATAIEDAINEALTLTSISAGAPAAAITLHSNLIDETISVMLNGEEKITAAFLVNTLGQTFSLIPEDYGSASTGTVEFNVSSVPAGFYILSLYNGTEQYNFQIVLE